jgi:hypothetical protein
MPARKQLGMKMSAPSNDQTFVELKQQQSYTATTEFEDDKTSKLLAALAWRSTRKVDSIPALIRPGLYLGSLEAFKNTDFLTSSGISHILTTAHGIQEVTGHENSIRHVIVRLNDLPNEDLLKVLPLCFEVISQGLEQWRTRNSLSKDVNGFEKGGGGGGGGGGVLVHCMAGKSRSASVVIGFLMKNEGLSFLEAFELVAEKRPQIALNHGFARQLRNYEATLKQ